MSADAEHLPALAREPITLSTTHWARNFVCFSLFIQFWLVVLHAFLARNADPDVGVLGTAFDITRETSVPSAFAALLSLIAAALAGAVASSLRTEGGQARPKWLGWLGLAAVFFVISLDDASAFHERVSAITSLELGDSLQYPSYPWHIVVAPAFVLALLLPLLYVHRDFHPQLKGMLIAALACYGLSLALDHVEGREILSHQSDVPLPSWLPAMMVTEECLEMIGTTFFCYAFLRFLVMERWGSPLRLRPAVPKNQDML